MATASRSSASGVATQRLLGSYYTPDHVALLVARWALAGEVGTVLDPSYGGCSFLRMAIQELQALGCADAPNHVYGADVDADTAPWTAKLSNQGVPSEHLHLVDFLTVSPGGALPQCSAVVGNPPYIRHHWLSPTVARSMEALRIVTGVSQRASAWAYFVLHAIDFVRERGRLAMLLPAAVLQADYAIAVRSTLKRAFDHVELVRVEERIFPDANEETVVLLAAARLGGNWRTSSAVSDGDVAVRCIDTVQALERLLAAWRPTPHIRVPPRSGTLPLKVPDYKLQAVSEAALRAASIALAQPSVCCLGQLAHIRIGTVTGANGFFVRDLPAIPEEPGIAAMPVVRRGSWLSSPRWTAHAHRHLVSQSGRGHLLVAEPHLDLELAPAFRHLVVDAESHGVNLTSHCQRRDPWWALRDVRAPDIFLPYMGAEIPRLTLNEFHAACTNAVHRIFWKERMSRARQAGVVASSYTSIYGLLAELLGRHYGGGVLKIEPSKAVSLPVIFDRRGDDALKAVERALQTGGLPAATKAADEHFNTRLGLTRTQVNAIRTAQDAVRALRP